MANFNSPVPQVVEGSNALAKLNQLIDAMSQALIGGKNWATTALLVWGYLGGRVEGINVANGTVSLTGSTTNYVVMKKSDGVVSTSTATTNWNNSTDYWRLYSVVTSSTAVTDYTDERFSAAGLFGANAGAPSTAWGDLTGIPAPIEDIAALTDPGADRILFWDDSAGEYTHLTVGSGLSISTTTLSATGGGTGDVVGPGSAVDNNIAVFDGTTGDLIKDGGKRTPLVIPIACSDETTALTTGVAKVTFRMPCAMTLTAVRSSVTTAPTGGTLLTVDINEGGSTILSTKLTIDASEKTSTTAATPAVISDTALADDAEMTIDIDAVGSTIAGAGLKVYLIGYPA